MAGAPTLSPNPHPDGSEGAPPLEHAEALAEGEALNEGEARFRALYEHSIDGILLTAPDGAILAANPEACRLLGRTEQEICRVGRAGITDAGDPRLARLMVERRATGQVRGQLTMLRGDGTPFEAEFTSAVFTDRAGRQRTSMSFHDVSRRKAAEEALHQANQQLEDRVAERTHALAVLLELSRDLASQLELGPLLAKILAGLTTLMEHTGAAITVLEGEELVVVAYDGPAPRDEVVGTRIPLHSESGYRRVVQARQPVVVDDIWAETAQPNSAWPIWGAAARHMSYVRAWLAAPLIAQGQLIGVLRVDSDQPGFFKPHATEHALAFASQAAVAIVNARLHHAAQEAAALAERQRLARELHDSVLQALYGITLAAHSAHAQLEPGQEALRMRLEAVEHLSRTALTELRAAVFELRAEALEHGGLIAALQRHADALRAHRGVTVELQLGDEPSLPLPVKEALYRIAQEALNNAAQHAGAQRATLRLAREGREVVLEIQDDGAGFDPAQPYPGHLGLRTMRERAELVGGRFEIDSAPSRGTLVRVRVALM